MGKRMVQALLVGSCLGVAGGPSWAQVSGAMRPWAWFSTPAAQCDHQSAHSMAQHAERDLVRLQAELADLDRRRDTLQREYHQAVKAHDAVAPVRLPVMVPVAEDRAMPTPELMGKLFALLDSPRWRGGRFIIEGHTERQKGQSAAYSKQVSMRMADGVRAYLVQHGIAADRIETAGFGDTKAREEADPSSLDHRLIIVRAQPQ